MIKIKTITLCGSLKFQKEMMTVAETLSLEGTCILTPIYPVEKTMKTKKQLELLRKEHFKKIDLSDAILVVNVKNYIGKSTILEIEYAKQQNKEILYYTDLQKERNQNE